MAELRGKNGCRQVTEVWGVSDKERVFILEYLKDLSLRDAAVRAGMPPWMGARLMQRKHVKAAVQMAMAERSVRVGINTDRVLASLGNLVFGDIRELYDPETGELRPLSELSADAAALIVGMKTKRSMEIDDTGKPKAAVVTEYKFIDKLTAHQLAMRHLGMFKDTLEINVNHTLTERMQRAQARVEGPKEAEVKAVDIAYEIDGVAYSETGDEVLKAEDFI